MKKLSFKITLISLLTLLLNISTINAKLTEVYSYTGSVGTTFRDIDIDGDTLYLSRYSDFGKLDISGGAAATYELVATVPPSNSNNNDFHFSQFLDISDVEHIYTAGPNNLYDYDLSSGTFTPMAINSNYSCVSVTLGRGSVEKVGNFLYNAVECGSSNSNCCDLNILEKYDLAEPFPTEPIETMIIPWLVTYDISGSDLYYHVEDSIFRLDISQPLGSVDPVFIVEAPQVNYSSSVCYDIEVAGNYLYYVFGDLYRLDLSDSTATPEMLLSLPDDIPNTNVIFGIAIDETCSNIYLSCPAIAYGDPNYVYQYSLTDSSCCSSSGDTPPSLSATALENECPTEVVDLTTITADNTPSGATLTWHTSTPATTDNAVADETNVGQGTYYAAFYNADSGCYSGGTDGDGSATTAITVQVNICCNAGTEAPDLIKN